MSYMKWLYDITWYHIIALTYAIMLIGPKIQIYVVTRDRGRPGGQLRVKLNVLPFRLSWSGPSLMMMTMMLTLAPQAAAGLAMLNAAAAAPPTGLPVWRHSLNAATALPAWGPVLITVCQWAERRSKPEARQRRCRRTPAASERAARARPQYDSNPTINHSGKAMAGSARRPGRWGRALNLPAWVTSALTGRLALAALQLALRLAAQFTWAWRALPVSGSEPEADPGRLALHQQIRGKLFDSCLQLFGLFETTYIICLLFAKYLMIICDCLNLLQWWLPST